MVFTAKRSASSDFTDIVFRPTSTSRFGAAMLKVRVLRPRYDVFRVSYAWLSVYNVETRVLERGKIIIIINANVCIKLKRIEIGRDGETVNYYNCYVAAAAAAC